MTEPLNSQELQDRFSLIENMIAEGRRTTESWGWTFVFWGVAYLVAIAWSSWGPKAFLAWPVTMIAATLLMCARIAAQRRRKPEKQPDTTLGRAIFSVWVTTGMAMFLLLIFLSMSGRFDWHVFIAVVCALLGLANAASSLILKWNTQFGCAVFWWGAMAAACFGSDRIAIAALLVTIFVCQIVFGAYCMVLEAREREATHA